MNKIIIPVLAIALVAVVMIVGAIIPAMAVVATGVIVSINPAGNHGVIERTDDGSGTLYQFNIPRDLGEITNVQVGKVVNFLIDPENSRHATFVTCGLPPC